MHYTIAARRSQPFIASRGRSVCYVRVTPTAAIMWATMCSYKMRYYTVHSVAYSACTAGPASLGQDSSHLPVVARRTRHDDYLIRLRLGKAELTQ